MPPLAESTYQKLLAEVRRVLERAKKHRSVNQEVLHSHWRIGHRLQAVVGSAAYGDLVVRRLSEDLKIDARTLERAVALASAYPEAPQTGLSWTHYRELLTISDPEERQYYERLAVGEGLSAQRLMAAIDADLFGGRKKSGGVVLERPDEPRYLYKAKLGRVVDGDTLVLLLDVGFNIVKEQRVRLVAVNTLRAASKRGKEAAMYVAARLTLADRIVVQTKRADLHGRYLAHVFYSTRSLGFLETFERGHYLNQQLLDRKLAMPMK